MATYNGTPFRDALSGTSGDDTINGFAGDDSLYGNGGRDTLYGGDGNDQLIGDTSPTSIDEPYVKNDILYGGAGDDELFDVFSGGGTGDYLIDGGDGLDIAYIRRRPAAGQVTISLENPAVAQVFGETTLVNVERIHFEGGLSNARVTGGSLDDYIRGSTKSDVLRGAGGNDQLDGGGGADRLYGDAGDDELLADSTTTLIDGGTGIDLLRVQFLATATTLSIQDPSTPQSFGTGTIVGVERIFVSGSAENDDLTGGAYADRLFGMNGDDVLNGGGGNDELYGFGGTDVLRGGDGDDLLSGDENLMLGVVWQPSYELQLGEPGANTLLGEGGNDTLRTYGSDGLIDGGTGTDLLVASLGHLSTGVVFTLPASSAEGMLDGTLVRNVERLQLSGSQGADQITGGALADRLEGAGGNDDLAGGGGDDWLDGNEGADVLFGGAGNDQLFSGTFDTSANQLYGEEGDDVLLGATGADTLSGNVGSDNISGSWGSDMLLGGAGEDRLLGERGNDIIIGGAGKDYLSGGVTFFGWPPEVDVFVFGLNDSRPGGGVRDTIADFEVGIDKIDVTALGITDFAQFSFTGLGTSGLGGLLVYGDLDGDGFDYQDFGVQLSGVTSLSASDFVFA